MTIHAATPGKIRHADPILRIIGIFKLLKSLFLFAAAIGALRLVHHDIATLLIDIAHRFHVAPGNRYFEKLFAKTLSITKHQWELLASVLAAYAVLFGIEGVGLLLQRHWAEWMTVITTTGLIPFEIYEVVHHFGWGKLAGFFINVVVVVYLIVRLKGNRKSNAEGAPDVHSGL